MVDRLFVFKNTSRNALAVGLLTVWVMACRPSIDDNAPAAESSAPATTTPTTTTATSTSVTVTNDTVTLGIIPTTLTIAPGSSYTFGAIGGTHPYAYTLVSGSGTVHSGSGLYVAPSSGGTASVQVQDSKGLTATATVTITSGTLSISPSTVQVKSNNTTTFSVSGGVPPYTYSIVAGSMTDFQSSSVTSGLSGAIARTTSASYGSVNSSSGLYTAPNSSGMSEKVRVTDSQGSTADATVTVVGDLDAGISHTCVMLNGGIKCWGANGSGQLGDSSTTNRSTPVIPGATAGAALSSGVVSLAAGGNYSCASLTSGAVKCWGSNGQGQLGDSSTTQRTSPVSVYGFSSSGALKVVASGGGEGSSTCIITTSGALKCFGENASYQLGDGTNVDRTIPWQAAGLTSGVTDASVATYTGCAVVNGGLKCWGRNTEGQLGLGSGDTVNRSAPVDIPGLSSGVTGVSVARHHLCALVNQGMQCWGYNATGQLGDGTGVTRYVAQWVSGLGSGTGVTYGSTGGYYNGSNHYYTSCAIVSGSLMCWGDNVYGKLAQGASDASTDRQAPLYPYAGMHTDGTPVAVAATYRHACVLYKDNRVQCVGIGTSGELGNGATATSSGVYVNVSAVPW